MIAGKYKSDMALFYRDMLDSWVRGKKFDKQMPPKNFLEYVSKKNN